MGLVELTLDRQRQAADILARAMVGEPTGRWLLPDPDELVAFHRDVFKDLIRLALDEGRVDAWDEPMVGVGVWLRRPAIDQTAPPSDFAGPVHELPQQFPAHAAQRLAQYAAVIRRLREQARPSAHAYLDSLAVLPEHRRRGIGSRLLEAGHAWADAAGLPCALETGTERNVAFYMRHGYAVVQELPLPGSGLRIRTMWRPVAG